MLLPLMPAKARDMPPVSAPLHMSQQQQQPKPTPDKPPQPNRRPISTQGLWRGTVPGLLLTVPYTAVQFVALQQVKDAAARLGWTGRDSPWGAAVSFGSGAVAGAAATVASYPFDLLRTTLAAQGEPKVRVRLWLCVCALSRVSGRVYVGVRLWFCNKLQMRGGVVQRRPPT
jgi:hypothetical protein